MTLREMWDQGLLLLRSFLIHHTHTHHLLGEKWSISSGIWKVVRNRSFQVMFPRRNILADEQNRIHAPFLPDASIWEDKNVKYKAD